MVLILASALAVPGTALAAPAGPAAQQLAERYAPVVVMREYDAPCGAGEPYLPMTVDPVLGNPEVALRQVGNGDPVIKWAPTAKDLYGRGGGVYLDFAGDALRPECVFAEDSARLAPVQRSAVYAHIAQQPDRPDFLAVQYWLYWYYNDWNDKHESDWEFIQVLFRATSIEQALAGQPTSVGYAQHEGGEVSAWGSDKLELAGSHPVVYSSERSHASYVEPALFLGRGASEGFGCDNTQAPSTRISPAVVLLPDQPAGPDDPFAWLSFQGRWGERHAAPNNGPTGPTAKPAWSQPVTWQDGLRPSSFVIPGGSAAPPPVVGTFCNLVERGSVLFIEFVASPAKVVVTLALLALVLAFLLRRTSWRRVNPLPVVSRRRAGEIAGASIRLYRRRTGTFAGIGLIAVPVGVVAALTTVVLRYLPVLGEPVRVSTDGGGAGGRTILAAIVAAAFWPVTLTLVSAAVAGALRQDNAFDTRTALRTLRRHARNLTVTFLRAAVLVGLLAVTVVGLPIAIWLAVRYQFLGQVVVMEGTAGRQALRRSAALVRHRWWHTAVIAALVWASVHVTGLILGLLLLVLVTQLPLWLLTVVVMACQIVLVPLGAIMLTLLYGDARAQHDERPPASAREPEVVAA